MVVTAVVVANAFEKFTPTVKTKLKGSVANVELTGELPWGGHSFKLLTHINYYFTMIT